MGWVGLKYERLPNFCYWCGQVNHGERECEMWLHNKGRLRKEDQQYGKWLRADSIRAGRKTVATILGAARSKVPWKKHSNVQSKVPHEVGEKFNKPVNASVHKEAWIEGDERSGSAFLNGNDSGIVNVAQQGSEDDVSKLNGLGKEWMGTMEVQGSHVLVLAQDDQPTTLAEPSIQLPGPTLLTRAWKRLAREVGKGQKENVEGGMLKTAVNTVDNGKRRMSIDLEDPVESKKQCMDVCEVMDVQSIEVVAASQHHRTL